MSVLGKTHARLIFGRRVRRLAELIAPLIPDGARVLDVGCGDGSLGAMLLALRPDLEISGIDVLRREQTHIPVVLFDGRTIPHPEDSFDAILLIDVLHHVDVPRELLMESRRVASEAIVIKDHLREGLLANARLRFMDWVGNAPHGVRLPYNYWTRAQWQREFEALGLTIQSWNERVGLYAAPASWIFDRSLHMVARLGTNPP